MCLFLCAQTCILNSTKPLTTGSNNFTFNLTLSLAICHLLSISDFVVLAPSIDMHVVPVIHFFIIIIYNIVTKHDASNSEPFSEIIKSFIVLYKVIFTVRGESSHFFT